MRWIRAFAAPLVLVLAILWLVASGGACARDASPQLIGVLDVSPREVELGERLAIVGQGFPPGKPARVAFRGTLYRSGERAVRGAEIVVAGTVLGPEQVEVGFGEATEALFCGGGDRAVHTTFEGEIEVAFAAAARAAPPIAGVLRGVTLDVRPSARPADAELEAEGERLLSFLGLHAHPSDNAGLLVSAVDPGSRGEAAGVAAGDIVARFDRVRVATAADVVPAPGEVEAVMGLRRGGATAETTRSVSVDSFRRAPPAELVGAALIMLASLLVVLLFAAPTRPATATAVQRVLSRVRARVAVGSAARGARSRRVVAAMLEVAREALPPAGPQALADTAACAVLATTPFGQYLVAAQLDVGLLFVAAVAGLTAAALVSNGRPWRGVRAGMHVLWQHVPAALAVACVVLATGSLRLQDIERAQGGLPWEWLAFRSPAGLFALAALLSCAFVDPLEAPRTGIAALVDADAARPVRPWVEAACRAHRVVVAGLASALFLGGWLIPGQTAAQQDARPVLEVAGAACLLAKTAGLVVVLAWARWALPAMRMADRSRAAAVRWLPLSLAALVATAVWTWWSPTEALQSMVSGALVAAVVLGAIAVAHRLRHALVVPASDGHVSAFL
jgi:NADH-quinone oxidoreductase subunit H